MKQEKEERLERQNKKLQETSIVVKPYTLNSGGSTAPAPKTTSPPTTSAPSPAKDCIIQIRLPEGTMLKATLQPTQTLADLVAFIIQSRSDEEQTGEEFSLLIPFPRKEFMPDQFETTTLQQAGLAPRGSINVQKLASKGVVTKGTGAMVVDNPDDEGSDEEPVAPPPFGGGRHTGGVLDIEETDVIPMEGDEQKRIAALLCSQQWLHSREEQKEGEEVVVFRPSTYKFPQTLSGSGKQRTGMNFLPSGSFSEARVTVHGQSSHVGTWKAKYDRRSNRVALELNVPNEAPKLYRVAALTDEVLVLSPLE
jgi:hypothetical protein